MEIKKSLVSNYVLNKFSENDKQKIDNQLNNITKNFNILLSDKGLFLTRLSESK